MANFTGGFKISHLAEEVKENEGTWSELSYETCSIDGSCERQSRGRWYQNRMLRK